MIIYIYIYTHTHTHTHIYIHTHAHIYIYIYICTYILDDIKKFSILKNGIGIECQKSTKSS